MQELFLTAVVNADDLERATAVLQGLCSMSAWQSTHRVLYFNGPAQGKGMSVLRSVQRSSPADSKLWQELVQQLSRQSYVLQTRYEVFKERDFGATNGVASGEGDIVSSLNSTQMLLRWTDIPDPTGNRPIMQRKKVDIPDQKNLFTVMQENNHKFKSEIIEESYSYFRDNIEYSLVRYFQLPPNSAPDGTPRPLQTLPAWDSLTSIDPAGKWMFFVQSQIQDDNAPDKMKKAHEVLMEIREELMNVFDFKVFDRRAHDTRVAQQVSNIPAPLPQTVRA